MNFLRSLKPQVVLVGCVILLLALSIVMIFSAGAFYHRAPDSFFLLRRQLLWVPVATLVGILFSSIDYRLYRRYYIHIVVFSVVLLALVLIPGVGRMVNSSRRWLPLGSSLQFQPSEFAKLAVVILVAAFVSDRSERTRCFTRGFLPMAGGVLVVFGLILAEPDLGTSIFVLGLAILLMLIAGTRPLHLGGSLLAVFPVLAIYVHLHWTTVKTRVLGFLDPESQYQTMHSLIALGAGNWFGVGLGAGTQKLRYLPEAHTDFIFAIIGEELGLVGCASVMAAFLLLIWSSAAIAWRSRDQFGFLLASGISLALGLQAAINIAVVTGSAPTKGIPLPLVSFGGSGLCMTLAQVGILLSIARVSAKELPRRGKDDPRGRER